MANHAHEAFVFALKYLGIRSRSTKEIRDYLGHKGFSFDDIDHTVSQLILEHLLNDFDFAVSFASAKAARGKGDLAIIFELHQKGISKSQATQALASIDDSIWADAIRHHIDKAKAKLSNLSPIQQTLKIKQTLFNKGYSSRLIDHMLHHAIE